MSQPVLIELNNHNGPQFQGQEDEIYRISVRNGTQGVNVVTIDNLRDFSLVQLTQDLRDRIQFFESGEYVGGILDINYVYVHTTVVAGVQTTIPYYRRVHISEIDSPQERIARGEIFLSNVDYPQLASNSTDEMVANRFYHDAARGVNYKSTQYIQAHGANSTEEFRRNQYQMMTQTAQAIRAMGLFQNGPVYPEQIVEELEEAFTAEGLDGIIETLQEISNEDVEEDEDDAYLHEDFMNYDDVIPSDEDEIDNFAETFGDDEDIDFVGSGLLNDFDETNDLARVFEENVDLDDDYPLDGIDDEEDLGNDSEIDVSNLMDDGLDIDFGNLPGFGN